MERAVERLTEEDFVKLKESFLQLDKNGDGKITRAELASSLGKQLQNCTKEDVDPYMSVLDLNKDRSINFFEFVPMMALFRGDEGQRSQVDAKQIFKVVRKDSDGCVTLGEMKRVWKLFIQPNIVGSSVEADKPVEHIDSNKDGKIDQKEFIDHLTSK